MYKKKVEILLNGIFEHRTTQIWTISKSYTEYENFSNMLKGEQKNALSPELINESLLSQSLDCLSLSKEVYIVHDGSDIRKSHAKKMESIAKVKDSSGNWVNGYNSFNSIAITDIDQKIHLLSCSAYSQGESHYNSAVIASKRLFKDIFSK